MSEAAEGIPPAIVREVELLCADASPAQAPLRTPGGEDRFQPGNGALALYLEHSRRLQAVQTLTDVMADYGRSWHVAAEILPMSDQSVAIWLDTDERPLKHLPN